MLDCRLSIYLYDTVSNFFSLLNVRAKTKQPKDYMDIENQVGAQILLVLRISA